MQLRLTMYVSVIAVALAGCSRPTTSTSLPDPPIPGHGSAVHDLRGWSPNITLRVLQHRLPEAHEIGRASTIAVLDSGRIKVRPWYIVENPRGAANCGIRVVYSAAGGAVISVNKVDWKPEKRVPIRLSSAPEVVVTDRRPDRGRERESLYRAFAEPRSKTLSLRTQGITVSPSRFTDAQFGSVDAVIYEKNGGFSAETTLWCNHSSISIVCSCCTNASAAETLIRQAVGSLLITRD